MYIIDLNGSKGHVYIWMCAYIYISKISPPPASHPLLAHSTLALTQGGSDSARFSNRLAAQFAVGPVVKENMRSFLKGINTQDSVSRATPSRAFWAWYLRNHTNHTPMKWSLISDLPKGKTASQREGSEKWAISPPQLLHPGRLWHPKLLPTYSSIFWLKTTCDKLVDATKEKLMF